MIVAGCREAPLLSPPPPKKKKKIFFVLLKEVALNCFYANFTKARNSSADLGNAAVATGFPHKAPPEVFTQSFLGGEVATLTTPT